MMIDAVSHGCWEIRIEKGGVCHLYVHSNFQSNSCILERKDIEELNKVTKALLDFNGNREISCSILDEVKDYAPPKKRKM